MAAQSATPGAVARNSTTLAQSSTIPSRRRAINLVRSRLLWLLPGMMILPEPWCFTIGPTRWTNTRSEQVHLHDKLQERRVKGAGLGVHGPTATAACISRPGRRPNPKSGRPQQPSALPPRGRSRRSRYPKRCRPLPQSRPLEAFEHRCLARTLHSPLAEENRGDGYRATTQAHAFLSNVNHFTY